jgi:hypothetical protein
MSGGSLFLYGEDGRMRGAYVYLLMCEVGDTFYIKVGMSIDPIGRMAKLRTGCPFTPTTLAMCNFWSNKKALRVERALQAEMRQYRSSGEWFAFKLTEKSEFNSIWKKVFAVECEAGATLGWTKVSVKELDRLARARKAFWLKGYRSNGRSYRDFIRQS